MNKLLTIVFMILIGHSLIAQDCNQNLLDARQAYFNGRFSEVDGLLSKCYRSFENENDKSEAYQLLINSALMLRSQLMADSLMFGLLDAFPLYEPRSTDLDAYKTLHKSYRIRKRFNLAFIVGLNSPNFQVMQYRSYGSITEEPVGYDAKLGYSIGTEIDWNFTDRFFLSGGLFFQSSKYEAEEQILDFQNVFIAERLSYLKIPIQGGIRTSIKGIDLFAQAGIGLNILINSTADLELFGEAPDFTTPLTGIPKKVQGYKLTDQRRSLTWNYLFTIGAQKTFGLYAIELSAQYDLGLRNLAKEESRYADSYLYETFSYVSDDFKMDNIQFRLGISRHLVIPEKQKR